jgi:hypothetical protein
MLPQADWEVKTSGKSSLSVKSSDVNARVQIMQPQLRLRTALFSLSIIVILALLGFTSNGVYRARFVLLGVAAGIALMVQFRRERALVYNRFSAMGVITEYNLSTAPKSLRVLISHFGGNARRIKYSFVAFDQRTYVGETGWNTKELRVGLAIPILYNPQDPAQNHPLTSFVFYSLHSP